MTDETSDVGDAGRTARAARASGGDAERDASDDARDAGDDMRDAGDDSRSAADGEVAPPGTREGARPAETASHDAAHRRWIAVAAACAVAAVVLLLTVGVNAAFVAAVLGVVAWFWDQRNRIRAGLIEDEPREEGRDELEEFDDDDEGGRDAGKQRSGEV